MTKRTNLGVLLGAVAVVGGFCLGWFGLRGFGSGVFVNGWRILDACQARGSVYAFLYLLPIGAAIAGALALVHRRLAAAVAMVVGGSLLIWGSVELLRVLWHTTFLGLWLTIFGAITLV